jgi:hypothetical protein
MSKKANPKKVLGKKLRKSTFQNINQKTYLKTPLWATIWHIFDVNFVFCEHVWCELYIGNFVD